MNKKTFRTGPDLAGTIEKMRLRAISSERKKTLQVLVDFIQAKINAGKEIQLNFICTHNSRRSQFSQIWAQAAANYYQIPAKCFSGGVEVTAFNERAVAAIKQAGFTVAKKGESNPIYSIHAHKDPPLLLRAFSKIHDDPTNPTDNFAAIMTCAHADENCPYIPGADQRIPIRYDDPKTFDDTPLETTKYQERSLEIATEMLWVFEKINKKNPKKSSRV